MESALAGLQNLAACPTRPWETRHHFLRPRVLVFLKPRGAAPCSPQEEFARAAAECAEERGAALEARAQPLALALDAQAGELGERRRLVEEALARTVCRARPLLLRGSVCSMGAVH